MAQRLDKWLVYARFCRHRSVAQDLVETGCVRLNRSRVEKGSQTVKPMDVLTLNLGEQVRVVRVLAEPDRRGPAREACLLYEVLEAREKADAQDARVG